MITITGRLPFDPLKRQTYPASAGDMTVDLELPDLRLVSTMLPPDYAASGSLHATLSLRGTMVRPHSRLTISAHNVTLPSAIQFLLPGPFDLTCDLEADHDRYSFSGLKLNGPSKPTRNSAPQTNGEASGASQMRA